MNRLPKARTSEIVEQPLGKELLIYDLTKHQAYNLNETASLVYRACDGATTFEDLKRRHKFTGDLIYFTLDELYEKNLVEKVASPFSGISRRDVVKRVGLATLTALPVISMLTAPRAAEGAIGSLGTYTCSNSGGVRYFCVDSSSTQADCDSGAKTQCSNCAAVIAALGCNSNQLTCSCGYGVCSNPGATETYFCASSAAGCSQARDRCRNCSASISSVGPCSSNSLNKITCTCT